MAVPAVPRTIPAKIAAAAATAILCLRSMVHLPISNSDTSNESPSSQVRDRLLDLLTRVHHERAVADDRFVDRLTAQQQHRRIRFRCDPDFFTVPLECHELGVVGVLA